MYIPFFPQSGFGFSYLAVLYLVSFKVCFFARGCFVIKCGLVISNGNFVTNFLSFEVFADLQAPIFILVWVSIWVVQAK